MTGKFHTTWGEFGGYKHPNALRYESALALANGAKMCIGDQMHPGGRLDHATYQLIGTAYAEVQEKEAWCDGVSSVADVGVLSVEALAQRARLPHGAATSPRRCRRHSRAAGRGHPLRCHRSGIGFFQICRHPAARRDHRSTRRLLQQLQAYLQGGGKIFATWESGLDPDRRALPARFRRRVSWRCRLQSLLPGPAFPAGQLGAGRVRDVLARERARRRRRRGAR